jgi:lysophospholipase L1-like esterase
VSHLPRWRPGILAAALVLCGLWFVVPSAEAATTRPVVAVVGDSYAAGWTATSRNQSDAWWSYTARDLGWQVGHVVADPGAGFVRPGDYGTLAQALGAHPIAASTDYVLVQAGLNDATVAPSQVAPAVAGLLAIIKRQAPKAVPIVVGAFMPQTSVTGPAQVPVARQIGNYTAIGASRYMIAFMCPFEVGPDGVHPTVLGHQQIGDWVAWHLANGLDNGKPLHLDPTGSFYTV